MRKIIRRTLCLVIAGCMLMGCGKSKDDDEKDTTGGTTTMEVKSTSITEDGKWSSVITKSVGEDKSPQLSWTPVEGATCYAVYMIDTSAGNWLHWKLKGTTKTTLEYGEKLDENLYVGPYPPSGTHTYVVTVYALAAAPDEYKGVFDNTNTDMSVIEKALDTANGKTGNIVTKGSVSATYTAGEKDK